MTSPISPISPGSQLPVLTVSVLLAALGLLAGAVARRVLGRLRRGARVPPPWCEAGTALVWSAVGAALACGVVPMRWVPVLLGLGWLAVAAGAVDLLHRRLPDALTLPALPAALLLLAPLGGSAVSRGAAGAAVAVAAHLAVHLAAPSALGAGDVKLAAPLGAVLAAASWAALVAASLVAALLSAVLGAVVLAMRGRSGAVPHGPSMLVAGLLVATAGARGP